MELRDKQDSVNHLKIRDEDLDDWARQVLELCRTAVNKLDPDPQPDDGNRNSEHQHQNPVATADALVAAGPKAGDRRGAILPREALAVGAKHADLVPSADILAQTVRRCGTFESSGGFGP